MIFNPHTQLADVKRCAQHTQNSIQHKSYDKNICKKQNMNFTNCSKYHIQVYAIIQKPCDIVTTPCDTLPLSPH